jgi:crotonobetainyl-CoA:carnitine CoA-transferase CaiB-like acyl-CoA transferase
MPVLRDPNHRTSGQQNSEGSAMSNIGPLEGLSVLEVTCSLGGSYCGKLLADMGAEVMKVEPPEGDPLRQWGPFPNDKPDPENSGLFLYLNSNKLGITLDLDEDEDKEGLVRLGETADLLIENVGLLERFLSLDALRRRNSRLTVTSISPFGLSGPYASYKGSELVLFNWSAFGWATPGIPDLVRDLQNEPPLKANAQVVDIATGTAAALGSLFALFGSGHTNRHVEISAHEVITCLNFWPMAQVSYMGRPMPRGPHIAGRQPNCYLECKDGWVTVNAATEPHWAILKEVLGYPEWAEADIFSEGPLRAANWDALEALMSEWALQYSGHEITEMLQSRGVPAHGALSIREALESDHIKDRQFLAETATPSGHSFSFPKPPFRFRNMPWRLRRPAPRLGEHNKLVLGSVQLAKDPGSNQRKRAPSIMDNGMADKLPLEGVRVVEFGQYIAVPFASQFLAWMGADVIQIESIHQPFRNRALVPFADEVPGENRGAMHNVLNSNKRSLSLYMPDPRARDLARRLISSSDVVMDNFSTGTMEKWDLGYQDLRRLRPDIVMLSLGAFGRTGPMKDFVGLHSMVNLFSGLAEVTGYDEGHPRMLGSYFPDTLNGTYAALAITAALRYREKTGLGQYIEHCMIEGLMTVLAEPIVNLTMNGRGPGERIGSHHPQISPHNVYRCKGEDAWIAISASSEKEWQALCDIMGKSALASDPRFAYNASRKRNEAELDLIIGEWACQLEKIEGAHLLQRAGVPAAPCADPQDVLDDPHLNERGFWAKIDHPELGIKPMVSAPWRISNMPLPSYRHAPLINSDNRIILTTLLGLSAEEAECLIADGVIQ